jgi:Xaa-Pro aminopeptidase
MCPYDLNLIEATLLSEKDKNHINQYHQKVYETLASRLEGHPDVIDWLKFATRKL